jgi:hypothetical protein
LDGLLEDTFIFYFGDHGGVLPGSKGYAYDRGLHVPLVVRVPKNWQRLVDASPGTRVTGFVSFVDFGPTLLHLAGIDVPEQVDGRPFLGRGVSLADVNQRDEAFGYADRFDEKYDLVRTLRKGRYEYVRSYQPFNFDGLHNNYRYNMLAYREWRDLYHAGKLSGDQREFFQPRAAEALYDLEQDPYETHNLATDPQYAAMVIDLRERLTRQVKSMPDLSLYPESFLVEHALDDPTDFAQSRREEIADLVDIADLSLMQFELAKLRIENALESENPWHRYWALIACSSHGDAASPLVEKAKRLAASDPERLVRVRAAEFLALVGAADPQETIRESLATAESAIEANLILNTLVLLRDGRPGYEFDVTRELFKFPDQEMELIKRRLQYLNSTKAEE